MPKKTTYKELGQRIRELEKADAERKQAEQALQESEERFRSLFEDSPIPLWEEDFSEVKIYIDSLQDSGIKNFRTYFDDHPEDVVKCASLVSFTGANKVALEFENQEEFKRGLEAIFTEESYDVFREEIIALAEGKTEFESENINQTLTGEKVHVVIKLSVAPGYEESLAKVLISKVDITERKRAEEALRNEKSLSEEYINSLPGLFYVIDDEERLIRWNKQWEIVSGYSSDELAEMHATDFFQGPDEIHIAEKMKEVFTKGLSESEAELVTKQGTKIPYFFSGSRIEINGKPHLIGLGINITERKQAEEAQQLEHTRMMSILNSIPDGVYIVSRQGDIEYVNPVIEQEFGPVAGRKCYEYLHARAEACPWCKNDKVFAGESVRWEWQSLKTDRHYDLFDMPFRNTDGSMSKFEIFHDTTEHKRAEELRIASEEREKTLADIVRSAPIAIVTGYPDGRIEKCNAAFEELTGYTLEELQTIDWNKALTPSKWKDIEARKMNEVLSGKNSVLFEKEYIRKDGSVVPIELLATATYDSEGKFAHITAFVHDITERRQAEDERVAHLDFLENLERVNQIIQETTDIGQMMVNVLQVSLEIFESDRAGLFFPCDPDAESWSVPMERTRPEYPSELPIGEDIPMTPEVAKVLRNALEKDEVITSIHQNEESIYETAERFSFLSEIYMPIHTHTGKSWLFVMHQCSYHREWTDEEQNLFHEIGHRIGDALSSLHFLHDLKESERSYRTLTENMPGTVYRVLHKENGRMLFFNDIVTAMTGYKPEELTKGEVCSIEPYIHPEDHDYVVEVVNEAIDGKATFEVEYRFIHKNGDIRHFYERGKPIFDSDGLLLSLDGIIFDITERKRAVEALQIERDNVSNILDTMNDGIYIVDHDYDIQYVNPVLQKDFGSYDGQKCYAYFHDMTTVCPWCKNKEVLAGKTVHWEFHVAKNGRTYDLIDTPLKNSDGSISKLEILRDITERKQTEQAVQQSENNFRTFFDTVDDFLFILDEQGNIELSNQTVIERLGYSAEELTGQPVLFVHPKERHQEAAHIVAQMLQGEETYCPVPLQTKSGELIPVETRVTSGMWNGKEAIFGVSKDVSALAISEEKFAKAFHMNPAIVGLSELESGKFIEVNQTFYDKLGFTPQETIGERASELVHMDTNFKDEAIAKVKETGILNNAEAIIYTKDGTPIDVLLSVEIIELQGKQYNFTTAIDITERKQADEKIKRQSGLISSLLDSIPDIIFYKDTDGVYLGCNSPFAKLVDRPKEEIVNKTDYDLFNRKIADAFRKNDTLMLKKRETRHNDEWITYPDGKKILIDTLKTPFLGPNGELLGILGISRDITERKQAEEMLRQSHERFSTVMDSLDASVYVADMETYEVLFVNKLMRDLFGTDMIGKMCWETIQSGQRGPCEFCTNNRLLDAKGEANDTYVWQFQNTITNRWYELRDQAIRWTDGRLVRMEIAIDITERKQAEAALQESETRLLEAQRIAHIGNWWHDLVTDEVYWSDEMFSIVGCERREVTYDWLYTIFHPDDIPRFQAALAASQAGQRNTDLDFRIVRPGGEIRHIQERWKSLFDSAGQEIRQIGTIQDITERKKMEEKLRQQATTDPLTGILNRRHFFKLATRELKRAMRYDHTLSVIMFDIDHFKSVNDTYGHSTGDQALRMLTTECQPNLRENDLFARYGGEEFIILLPETDLKQAKRIAERTQKRLSGAESLKFGDDSISLTASFGVASLDGEKLSLDDLIMRADSALYAAKDAGRNRVEVWTPEK
ncbi:MAG: PAS domain S-box protein [Chloroflexi bacterium]|nr:PAS domain S-box protein [Chloroflexota bacterium]